MFLHSEPGSVRTPLPGMLVHACYFPTDWWAVEPERVASLPECPAGHRGERGLGRGLVTKLQ